MSRFDDELKRVERAAVAAADADATARRLRAKTFASAVLRKAESPLPRFEEVRLAELLSVGSAVRAAWGDVPVRLWVRDAEGFTLLGSVEKVDGATTPEGERELILVVREHLTKKTAKERRPRPPSSEDPH